jgi:L-lactate utilization protein LutC
MERQVFLGRLKQRLEAAAPPATAHPPGPPPAVVPRVTFPADERSLEERFGAALHAIRGRLVTLEELPGVLAELEVRTAVVTDERLPLGAGIERLPLEQAAVADAGVTAAVAACAATGTVVLAPSPVETRMASLLPRVHVVAVPREVLVETPGDVLRELPRWFPGGLPSAFALASGPSKSADIDAEVTYGVHGPLAVVAVLV